MIRVMIVEDEPPIARLVKGLVEQASPFFEVVSCEDNGQMALERFAQEPVDLVITDIRMPVMDGLQLLEQLHEKYPLCVTVVLSGYQDFSYAQSALRQGAFDYLLKPVSREKLSELLLRVEQVWRDRRRGEKSRQLQESILGDSTELPADGGEYMVLLLCAGAWPLTPDDMLAPGQAFWLRIPLEDHVKSFVNAAEEFMVISGRLRTEKVLLLEHVPPQRARKIAASLFELLTLEPIPITILGWERPVPFAQVGEIMRKLRTQLHSRITLCNSQLQWLSDDSTAKAHSIGLGDYPVSAVVESIATQNPDRLVQHVTNAVTLAAEQKSSQLSFVHFLDAVISDSRLVSMGFSPGELKLELDGAVSNAVSPDGLSLDIASIFSALMNTHTSAAESRKGQEELARHVEEFLTANFQKPISNEMLSQQFGFVPSYISKLFRRYRGVSPSEYITRYRLNRAKDLMRERPELLVRDVAALAGYNDPYYFSRLFKKEVGVWPSQFQAEPPKK